VIRRLRTWARVLKIEVGALALAARDPRTPLLAKIVVVCVVGYALSPIDLVPDPIPVLGYLDDLILLPLGIALAIRLVPEEVMRESRAAAISGKRPANRVAAAIIVLVWIAFAVAGFWWLHSLLG
jgi:uncharacterized membrane protein YkvA (DUF1232 family)